MFFFNKKSPPPQQPSCPSPEAEEVFSRLKNKIITEIPILGSLTPYSTEALELTCNPGHLAFYTLDVQLRQQLIQSTGRERPIDESLITAWDLQ